MVLLASLATGCDDATEGTDGGGVDAALSDAGGADGGAGACVLPTLERGCAGTANCVVALHQIDCCGTFVAIGVNHSERDSFDAFEAACEATYPGCGCASRETMADDGTTGFGDPTVECLAGVCTTSFATP